MQTAGWQSLDECLGRARKPRSTDNFSAVRDKEERWTCISRSGGSGPEKSLRFPAALDRDFVESLVKSTKMRRGGAL